AAEVSGEKPKEFVADPKQNFLPHMVAVCKEAGLPLCFVREKRHPSPNNSVPETPELEQYIRSLHNWTTSQGCSFVDLTSNPMLTEAMYLKNEDDHIRPKTKLEATSIYAEALRPILAK